jgi:hypothetical protein
VPLTDALETEKVLASKSEEIKKAKRTQGSFSPGSEGSSHGSESKFWNSSKWARKLSKVAVLSGDGGKEQDCFKEIRRRVRSQQHVVSVSKTCWIHTIRVRRAQLLMRPMARPVVSSTENTWIYFRFMSNILCCSSTWEVGKDDIVRRFWKLPTEKEKSRHLNPSLAYCCCS